MAPGERPDEIAVEVLYAPQPHQIDLTPLKLQEPATAIAAVQASGVLQRHGLDPQALRLGVWGRVCEATQRLREHDRVEIYRPLTVDPKEARRLRYRKSRKG